MNPKLRNIIFDLSEKRNLFIIGEATRDSFLDITSGGNHAFAGTSYSGFIRVFPLAVYETNANMAYTGAGIAYYDINKTLVSCTHKGNDLVQQFTTDIYTQYIRVSLDTVAVNINTVYIKKV